MMVALMCSWRWKNRDRKIVELTDSYLSDILRRKTYNKMFKFGQIEVASKEFNKQRQVTDIFTTDVNKVVGSEKVSCKNGKDHRYIIGYQVDGEKHLKTSLAMAYHSMIKNLLSGSRLLCLRKKNGCLSTKGSGMKLNHSYLKNWQRNQ